MFLCLFLLLDIIILIPETHNNRTKRK